MPPKVGVARNIKKVVQKVDHKGKVFTYIPAQNASPSPPLGSQLGQIGVNISNFVKDFNQRTSHIKVSVPIPSIVRINPDRTYNLTMSHPPWSYFIKQAAGIQRGAMNYETQISGYITRKHVFEIAKLKSEDELWQEFDLKVICEEVIDQAYSMGVHVVDHLDAQSYGKFLEERGKIVAQEKAAIQAEREAKLLRT